MPKLIKIVSFKVVADLKKKDWRVLHTSAEGVTMSKDVDGLSTWEEIVEVDAGTRHTKQNSPGDWVA